MAQCTVARVVDRTVVRRLSITITVTSSHRHATCHGQATVAARQTVPIRLFQLNHHTRMPIALISRAESQTVSLIVPFNYDLIACLEKEFFFDEIIH